MAGIDAFAQTDLIQTSAVKLTLLQLVAAANHRVKVQGFSISFQGVVNTDSPLQVELVRQSTAGTMTALTCIANDESIDETLQTTAQHTATVEPTEPANSVIVREFVHPQGGFTYQSMFAKEILIGGGNRLGMVVTASVDIPCVCRFFFEE